MEEIEITLDYCTLKITDNLKTAAKSFIKIGYYLWHVKAYQLYKDENFLDFADYVRNKFSLGLSTVYKFINICLEYSQYDGKNPSPYLASQYREYNSSQLIEMLALSSEDRKEITPDKTIQEIRKIKRERKKVEPKQVEPEVRDSIRPIVVSDIETVSSAPDVATQIEESPYESLDYQNSFEFTRDSLGLGKQGLYYERTIKVVQEAADYSAVFPKIVDYLSNDAYAIRICLYKKI